MGTEPDHGLTFRLYKQAEGGAPLWEQTFPDPKVCPDPQALGCDLVAVQDGYFTVMLGTGVNPADGKPLSVSAVFAQHDATWITVCVGAGCTFADDMKPRQQVGSVPYAVKAESAAAVGGTSDSQLRHYTALAIATAGYLKSWGSHNVVEMLKGNSAQVSCGSYVCKGKWLVGLYPAQVSTGGDGGCSTVAEKSPGMLDGYYSAEFACCQ